MDPKHKENMLEALLMEEEMGERQDLQSVEFADRDVEELVEEGLVEMVGGRPSLTASGRVIAEDVTRRHRLTEVMLATLLGLDKERASEIGCVVEHDIRPEMLESICTLLGHPPSCPHGSPIPPGPCCRAGRTSVEQQVVPLTTLAPGERGRIVYITPRDHQRLHRLTSLGLTPGVVVEIHRRHPAFCIRFEETDLAIDRDVAGDIHVSRLQQANDS